MATHGLLRCSGHLRQRDSRLLHRCLRSGEHAPGIRPLQSLQCAFQSPLRLPSLLSGSSHVGLVCTNAHSGTFYGPNLVWGETGNLIAGGEIATLCCSLVGRIN